MIRAKVRIQAKWCCGLDGVGVRAVAGEIGAAKAINHEGH
jgi:hypothetical protein